MAKSDKKIPLAGEWDVGQSAALQLLGELQKNGRLLDFLEEDLSRYKDEEIGASVRPIHEGCRAVINKIFTCQPIVVQSEDSRIRINENYNAQEIKLCGRVTDKYPLRGTIVHPGWKATKVSMAERPAHLQGVIVPAEVEIE